MQSVRAEFGLRHCWSEGCDGDTNVCYSANFSNTMSSTSRSRHRRSEKKPIPDDQKDEKYYERRKRNNQAAKKSRDARRIREDFMTLRTKMLENENGILRKKIILLGQEIESLHAFILEIQRQIPEKLDRRFWLSNSLQSCCLKNFNGSITIYPPTTADVVNTTASVTALTAFISRLSSILQTPTYSPL